MKTKIKIPLFFIYLLVFLYGNIPAQNDKKTDSLLNVYNSTAPDSSRLKALNTLFLSYQANNDEMAAKYAALAVSFGAKGNDKKGNATALYQNGQYQGRHGNFDSSGIYLTKALNLFTTIGDKKGQASCYNGLGLNKYDQSKYKEALSFFLKSLNLREEIKDKKGIASSYTWIGNVYNTGLFQPVKALDYYNRALKINTELNDEKGLASSYNNLGNVNYLLNKYEEALPFYLKALALKEKLNDKKGSSNTLNNLGNVSAGLKDFDKAIGYFKKARVLYEEFGDQAGIVSEDINIGNVFMDRGNYRDAVKYHEQALILAKEIYYREGLRGASYELALCYEKLNEPVKALKYFKFNKEMSDSILNTDFNDQVVEMETKYQAEKKELENTDLKKSNTIKALEIEKQKQSNYVKNILLVSVILLLVMLSISAYLFYNKKKISQKAELDAEITRQKEIRIKAVIETEEKERIRIARDLHDGIGQLLSAAKMNLSSIEKKIEIKGAEQQSAFKNAVDLLDESVKEVRAVSHNMMPNTLLKLGLASAVREFITKIQNMPDLKVRLEIVGMGERLEQEQESILYRVIQEVISNIIKHAKASELVLQLVRHEKELSVIIEDNGVGFDTSKINDFGGIGLKNILSRVEFINGSVHFDSAPGRGTSVLIDVPLS